MHNKKIVLLGILFIGISAVLPVLSNSEVEIESSRQNTFLISSSDGFEIKKYVELVVSVDKEFIEIHNNNTLEIIQHVSKAVNLVNEIYVRHFNISIILINVTLIHDWGSYEVSPGPTPLSSTQFADWEYSVDALLTNFSQYRMDGNNLPSHDFATLLSGKDFQESVLGYAGVSTMGNAANSNMIAQTQNTTTGDAFLIAHEMGHSFGMWHDGVSNECDNSGYIMSAVWSAGTFPTDFSACSTTYLIQFLDSSGITALDNVPTDGGLGIYEFPTNITLNTLAPGKTLYWNVSNVMMVDLWLNGVPAVLEIDLTAFQDNFTLSLDQLGLVEGNNSVVAKFYDYRRLGSATPWVHNSSVVLGGGLAPALKYPIGGETLNGVANVTWIEGSSASETTIYSLYYKTAGADWILIDEDIHESNFLWNTTNLDNSSAYELKILAKDFAGSIWVADYSNTTFSISNYIPIKTITNTTTTSEEVEPSWIDALPLPLEYMGGIAGGIVVLFIIIGVVSKKKKVSLS